MESAVEATNWEAALSSVERNAGAPGPDGMKARELREHLAKHGIGIKAKLLNGSFKPSAARRKEIPKPNGGIRPLSICQPSFEKVTLAVSLRSAPTCWIASCSNCCSK